MHISQNVSLVFIPSALVKITNDLMDADSGLLFMLVFLDLNEVHQVVFLRALFWALYCLLSTFYSLTAFLGFRFTARLMIPSSTYL